MKKTRFTENQIIAILKEGEAGIQAKRSAASTGSQTPHTTIGNRSTAARVPLISCV